MHWLQSLDVSLFRFINQTLQNSFFDRLMPLISGNSHSRPLALVTLIFVGVWLVWKNPPRGTVCLFMLALIIWPGDTFICNKIKHAINRPRPFVAMPATTLLPAGRGGAVGMPSSHAANWGAATMIMFIYYRRRSLRIMLPFAAAVCFSRVYNGVHYPSDVLVGAILGASYAAGIVWALDALWRWAGRRWLPDWWQKIPSLLAPDQKNFTGKI